MVVIDVKVTRIRDGAALPACQNGHNEDAGLDLRYCGTESVTLTPGARYTFPTGIAIELPPGYEGQIRSRSGLAKAKGVIVLNSPGTIDPGYRGELGVLLINLSTEPQTIEPGERIAQLVVAPYAAVRFAEVEVLTPSKRGEGGFGSTGKH